MSQVRTLATGLLFLCGVNVAAYSADLPNSQCLPTGSWRCLTQGQRICAQKPNCQGDCYGCLGSPTLPEKMCFDMEGSNCTSLDPVICSMKLPDGSCITEDGSCTCKVAYTQDGGVCTSVSCNN
jgi:hypothetical protein